MKHIVLTGGGTAGHVTPNIALIPKLRELGYKISYIGSYEGIEKKLIEELGIPYYGISSGKLRRYFDLKNFSDPFRVLKGFSQARKILKELVARKDRGEWRNYLLEKRAELSHASGQFIHGSPGDERGLLPSRTDRHDALGHLIRDSAEHKRRLGRSGCHLVDFGAAHLHPLAEVRDGLGRILEPFVQFLAVEAEGDYESVYYTSHFLSLTFVVRATNGSYGALEPQGAHRPPQASTFL